MTRPTDPLFDQRIADWLEDDPIQAPGQVLDVVLAALPSIPRRHALRVPWRFPTMTMTTRLATAAVIGVLAVGGAFYLLQRNQSTIGGPSQAPGATAGPTTSPASTQIGPMTIARQIHTATRLVDGRVLIAGGYTDIEIAVASVELYDPASDTFRATGSMSAPRGLHTATLLTDGRVLITGGGPASWTGGSDPYLASAEIYDPTTGTFSVTGAMSTAREDHTATLLADGRVLITGGDDAGSHAVATAEIYDPTIGTFTATGSMATARGFHTATLLADGRVLIVGGDDAAWTGGPFLASAEIYDPKTGTFRETSSLAVGRQYHTATLLADGRVLVSGGAGADGGLSLATAEMYDPATGTFSATGSMTAGRIYQTATRLLDGRVVIVGGLPNGMDYAANAKFLASADIFDPTTGTFTSTGSMAGSRTYQAAALLIDGRLLITGGVTEDSSTSLASAEIYDPATGTFSQIR